MSISISRAAFINKLESTLSKLKNKASPLDLLSETSSKLVSNHALSKWEAVYHDDLNLRGTLLLKF